MDLRRFMSVVIKWWWLIALTVIVALISSYFGTLATPRSYQSRITLMVGQALQNPNPTQTDLAMGQALALSYSDMTTREPVISGTLNALNLPWPIGTLQSMVSSRVLPGTQIVEVTVVDNDPRRAQVLATEIANQIIAQSPTAQNAANNPQRQFMDSQVADLEAKITSAQSEIHQLDDQINKANSASQIQDARSRQSALQDQVSTWQFTYSQLLTAMQQGTSNYLSIFEPATLPSTPFSPNLVNNLLLAAAIGLILSGGTAFLLEFIDDTIKNADDVRRVLGMTTLGGIAPIDGKNYPDRLVVVTHPLAPVAEAFRALRTSLQYIDLTHPIRTLIITSPNPKEGKSVVAANVAAVLAQSGKRVILVDADLRRPVQHEVFRVSNQVGLTDLLIDKSTSLQDSLIDVGIENLRLLPAGHLMRQTAENLDQPISLQDKLIDVGVKNLRLLPAGPLPSNAAELLGSKRMDEVIQALQQDADIVVFDTSPVIAVADTSMLATRVDSVLMVIDSGRSRIGMARRAKEALTAVGAPLLGVVLNRLSERGNEYYYYYGEYGPDGQRRRRRRSSSSAQQTDSPG